MFSSLSYSDLLSLPPSFLWIYLQFFLSIRTYVILTMSWSLINRPLYSPRVPPSLLSRTPSFFSIRFPSSSVFHDFGKEVGRACPYTPDLKETATNNFFIMNVIHFMTNFPSFHFNARDSPFAEIKIEVGSTKVKKYSPEAFARLNARNGFHSACKKFKN